MDEIHRALAENLVIFFRDQHITPAQHLAFGRKFGDLHIHPAAPSEGEDPALMKIYADKDSPRANGEGWHTDVSCDVEPPMGSILYVKQCPPRGGDTLFASMYAAYESLSDRMKAYLDGLTAIHDGEQIYRGLYDNYGVADKPSYPRAEHPVVRTHPVTERRRSTSIAVLPAASSASPATRATPSSAISTSTWKIRCSSAVSAGPRMPSRSGTTAAPSTARCGITGRTPVQARG
jgi:alpha-ketoglutarate-dependent taurine dioxygenase